MIDWFFYLSLVFPVGILIWAFYQAKQLMKG
jgi:hypothetical protein